MTDAQEPAMKAAALAFIVLCVASPLGSRQSAVKSGQKCTLEGQVVDAVTGQALDGAQINLHLIGEGSQPPGTRTDALGHFLFSNVEPGQYYVFATREGYLERAYGQHGPRSSGTVLLATPGQHLSGLVIALAQRAVIKGLITDEGGKPFPGLSVQGLRESFWDGRRQFDTWGATAADALGNYRLEGLIPGRYLISATYVGTTGSGSTAEEDYVPFYYPGTSDPGVATRIELRPGAEVRADMTLFPVPAVRVRGRITRSDTGKPARDANVHLMEFLNDVIFYAGHVSVDPTKGTFEIRGVAPGSYVLFANQNVDPNTDKYLVGQERLEVGEEDIEDVNILLGPGVQVRGRIATEGSGQVDFSKLDVYLAPRSDVQGSEFPTDPPVGFDGRFTLEGITGGTYNVVVSGLAENWYLKSVLQGTQDILDSGLYINSPEAPAPLELTLSSGAGQIEGVVLDRQQPVAGANVVLVPSRREQTHLYMSSDTDRDGRFALHSITPGEYKLFAWEDRESVGYKDPSLLRPYEDRGQLVRIKEGNKLSARLELIPVLGYLP